MVEGLLDLGTAVMVCSPYPRLYTTVARVTNTTANSGIQSWDLLQCSHACYQ